MKQLIKEWLRKCFVCNNIKPLDKEHFYRNKSRSCWFDTRCIVCSKIRKRNYNRKKDIKYKWYVYIIKCEDNYKIWVTKHDDIKKRIDDMQCWNPHKLKLHKMYYTEDMFKKENDLHKNFKYKHIRWEWYKLNLDDLNYINLYLI